MLALNTQVLHQCLWEGTQLADIQADLLLVSFILDWSSMQADAWKELGGPPDIYTLPVAHLKFSLQTLWGF